MLIGYLENEAKTWRYIRRICWTMVRGYADPKKLPANESDYWHIEGDPIIKQLSQDEVKSIVDKFRATKWTLKYQ